MKRLLAVLMSAMLIIGCVPMMAFADTTELPPELPQPGDAPREGGSPGSVDPNHEDVLRDADGQIRDLTLGVKRFVTSREFIDMYDKVSELVDGYKPLVDDFVNELRAEKGPEADPDGTKDIDYYGKMVDAYIRDLNNILVDYQKDDNTKEKLEQARDKLVEVGKVIDEYDLNDRETYDKGLDNVISAFREAQDDMVYAVYEDVVEDSLRGLISEARDLAGNMNDGLTKDVISSFLDQSDSYMAIAQDIASKEKSFGDAKDDILDVLKDQAWKLIEDNAEEIAGYAIGIMENWDSGKYDKYIEKLGLDPKFVKDFINDFSNYIIGYMFGASYQYLEKENEKINDKYIRALDKIDMLKEAKSDNKKLINALKVIKKKPALKKVKAKGGRKVQVSFKGLKGAKAVGYQISYKTGKKAKTKTYYKMTSSAKSLKYTLKKLSKGKTYTVKVRAIYEFDYNYGKLYKAVSKWSKAKKVKVR